MTDTRGTFKLRNVRQNILNDEYVPFSEVYLKDNDVGHFRDGNPSSSPGIALSRTNLGTELTVYAPGITNITRWSAGSSCETHALFAGGGTSGATSPPSVSSTYKLTYSSLTSAQAPAAPLPIPKAIAIGVASEDNAYINSGYEAGGSPSGQTGTCKISFATDTTTNLPSANVAGINWEMQSLTDGAGGGYLFGGTWIPGQANTGSRCYKITYATDALAQLPGSNTTWNPTETNRNPETSRASMMNRTAGYQSGGNSFPGSGGSSMTTKLTYSSTAWSVVPGAYLPNPRRKAASGTGNTKAWYGCGDNGSTVSNFTLLDFSDETWSAVPGMNHPGPGGSGSSSANTSTSPRDSLKGADKASRGYDGGKGKRWYDDAAWSTFGGGSGVDFDGTGDYLTTNKAYVDMSDPFCVEAYVKWDSVGSPSDMGMIFSQYESGQNGRLLVGSQSTNNCVVRWNGGGVKLETGTDTITTGTWYHVAWTWDNETHRLFLDGKLRDTCTSSDMSVIYVGTELEIGGQATLGGYSIDGKISNFRVVQGDAVYTESFTPPTGEIANIAGTKLLCCQSDSSVTAATVSDGPITSAGDPTVFTDDKTLPINKAPNVTPTPSTSLSGPQGVRNEGYLIQGIQGATSGSGRSDSYKLDYTTETWSSSANSTLTRKRGGAASTTTNAYIGGGTIGSTDGGPTGGDMNKLTYATSTMSRMPGSDAGRIPARDQDAQPAAGNQTLGYWGGGYGGSGAGTSHIDKFVYSSETAASLPNFPWPQNKLGVAVAMQTHAYLGAGPADTGTNFVKITFANDTYSSKSGWTKSSGTDATYRGATSSPTKAYIVGGVNMERYMDVTTWASDTTSSSPSTFLASPGFSYAPGQGGNEAGYFTGGGNTGNNGTTTEKITFASDTTYVVPSAYFSSSSPSGINSYTTGGPNMNGVGDTSPNVI